MGYFVGDNRDIAYSGFVIAFLGFLLTRFFVVEGREVEQGLGTFILAGAIPLVLGLGLSALGVALAFGPLPRYHVDRMAFWSVLGTTAMVVVLGITTIDAAARGVETPLYDSGVLVGNILLGGATGGVVIGYRSAENFEHRRAMATQADRGVVLNRILRHEILNAASIIGGYAELLEESFDERPSASDTDVEDDRRIIPPDDTARRQKAIASIRSNARRIDDIVQDVGHLVEVRTAADLNSIALEPVLADVIGRYRDRGVAVQYSSDMAAGTSVVGDHRIELLLRELLENAVEYGGGEPIHVTTFEGDRRVRVRITDAGPGLPDRERAKLEAGNVPTYDDPTTGFGLPIVRFIADQFDADIVVETPEASAAGTSVEIGFRRPGSNDGFAMSGLAMLILGGVALVAGVAMGLLLDGLANGLPVIGALYGVENAMIGWITHLFHSVVFGLIFAAGIEQNADRLPRGIGWQVGLGAGWGVILWLVAAGVVMPVWLNLVGVPATIPRLDAAGLLGHVVWGVLLGGLYAIGKESLLEHR